MGCKNSNILSDRESIYDRKKLSRKEKREPSGASIYDFFYSFFIIYIHD